MASPPPGSLSEKAQAAFSRLYPRDFGASPSLFVVMEASNAKRFAREQQQEEQPEYNSFGQQDSYSFTDDTSAVYSEGKQFAAGIEDYLTEHYSTKTTIDGDHTESSVQVTTYYSLQERGLDYFARNMVAPDGSKTMIQIQYLRDELGNDGIQKLKESILKYGQENNPFFLDLHFTGQTWNPPVAGNRGVAFGVATFVVGAILFAMLGLAHPVTQWYLLIVGTMVSSLSMSMIVLARLTTTSHTTTSLALSAMTMVSFVLSVAFAKAHIDANDGANTTKAVRSAIFQSGIVLGVACASLSTFSSPTLQSVGVATTLAVATSVLCHSFLAPQLLQGMEGVSILRKTLIKTPSKMTTGWETTATENKSKVSSIAVLVATGACLFPLAYQVQNLPSLTLDGIAPTSFLTGLSNDRFRAMGESIGHGRLTPYRILFDGSKAKQKMVTLGGYDIVQMVVDELVGISISDGNRDSVSDDSGMAGSTHIGEEKAEVQDLIKELIDTLTRFKNEQQREFDSHHQKRQARWREQQKNEDNYARFLSTMEDIRCDYNINTGLHATTYSGIAVLENSRIPHSLHHTANLCRTSNPQCPSEALNLLNFLEDQTTTPDQLSTFVTVNLGVDPFSWKGIEWLSLARETIDRLQKDPRILGGTEIHIDGPPAVVEDLYNYEHRSLQRQFFLAVVVATVALVVSFWGFFVPLQIVARVSMALTFSLGVGNSIYRNGDFNWLHLSILSSKTQGAGMTAFPEAMICLLVTSTIVVSGILSARLKSNNQESLISAPSIIAGSLCLLEFALSSSKETTLQWPLIVAIALSFEGAWVRQFVLPALSDFLPRAPSPKSFARRIDTRFGGDVSAKSRDHAAYLEKFDSFVRSPHAP